MHAIKVKDLLGYLLTLDPETEVVVPSSTRPGAYRPLGSLVTVPLKDPHLQATGEVLVLRAGA